MHSRPVPRPVSRRAPRPVSRRSVLAAALASTVLPGALASCASGTGAASSRASSSSSAADDALVIGLTYTPNVQFAPFYLALQGGRYSSAVSLRHHGEQEGQFDALLAGTEHIVVAGADEALVAASNGSGLVVIGGFYQRYPGCIIVPDDSAITGLADLEGRTIGTPGRTGETWYALQVALSTAGLTQDQVSIEDIGYTQQAALVAGRVDAVVGFSNNDAVQISQSGTAVRTIPVAQDVPLVGASLVTTTALLASRREALSDAVTASAAGMAGFVDDPDAAVEATRAYVTDLADQTQAAHAREVAVATGELVRPDDSTVVGSLDESHFAQMVTFLVEHDLLGPQIPQTGDVCRPLLDA